MLLRAYLRGIHIADNGNCGKIDCPEQYVIGIKVRSQAAMISVNIQEANLWKLIA